MNVAPQIDGTTCDSAAQDVSGSGSQLIWDEVERLASICVACMENEASFVCSVGHLIVCRQCRRKLVLRTLQATQPEWQHKSKRDLQGKQLDRTPVPCPMCRSTAPLVLVDKFVGIVLPQDAK